MPAPQGTCGRGAGSLTQFLGAGRPAEDLTGETDNKEEAVWRASRSRGLFWKKAMFPKEGARGEGGWKMPGPRAAQLPGAGGLGGSPAQVASAPVIPAQQAPGGGVSP